MDTISIVIIVTVLSLGSALVYLFKSDFERRKRRLFNNSEKPHFAINNNHTQSNARKQSVCKQPNSTSTSKHIATNKSHANAPNASDKHKQVPPGGESNKPVKQITTRLAAKKDSTGERPTRDLEPSLDELDSSILLEVFDPTTSRQPREWKHQENLSLMAQCNGFSLPGATSSKAGGNKQSNSVTKHNKQPAKAMGNPSMVQTYSSDELFNIIAASILSREEIELAIETLLNKGETNSNFSSDNSNPATNQPQQPQQTNLNRDDWRQPKNDPLQKLKNQLRETESALTIEVQNHELTRARLVELKQQLQEEKSQSLGNKEELAKLSKEFKIVNLALEQAKFDLNKQQMIQKQLREEKAKLIGQFDQTKSLANELERKNNELLNIRKELEEKACQFQRYELTNQSLNETIVDLECKLRQLNQQFDQVNSNKQHDDYEACAKINELESDKMRLEKLLKDCLARLNELSETNNLLEKSLKEMQLINSRQEEMLTRLRDERNLDEESMKRTLNEMDRELKELQNKLSMSLGSPIKQQQMSNKEEFEANLSDKLKLADEREQELTGKLKELRDGLAMLIPDLRQQPEVKSSENWIQHYLDAVRQLGSTVDELKNSKSSGINDTTSSISLSPSPTSSPSKRALKSPIGSARNSGTTSRLSSFGSPTSEKLKQTAIHKKQFANEEDREQDSFEKKMMETKLLELSDYATELESKVKELEQKNRAQDSSLSSLSLNRMDLSSDDQERELLIKRIKDLTLQRNKFEAQIKFGLDSLRMEQERVSSLESQLAELKSQVN